MKITWYGQASFGIETDGGLRIVTDPYDPATSGFKPFPDPADVIIMSSDNDSFHCNAHLVPKRNGAEVINALAVARGGGTVDSHGVTFLAIEAMEHLQHHEHDPDQNGMYRFAVDGIDFGHMGDVGNAFSDDQLAFFRGVDVLFALAGGHPVVELEELRRIVDATRPRLVIPMHFRTLCYRPRNMFFISEFLKYFPEHEVDFAFSDTAELSRDSLPQGTRALVIDYR